MVSILHLTGSSRQKDRYLSLMFSAGKCFAQFGLSDKTEWKKKKITA